MRETDKEKLTKINWIISLSSHPRRQRLLTASIENPTRR